MIQKLEMKLTSIEGFPSLEYYNHALIDTANFRKYPFTESAFYTLHIKNAYFIVNDSNQYYITPSLIQKTVQRADNESFNIYDLAILRVSKIEDRNLEEIIYGKKSNRLLTEILLDSQTKYKIQFFLETIRR